VDGAAAEGEEGGEVGRGRRQRRLGVVEGREREGHIYTRVWLGGRGGHCESLICRPTASNGWRGHGTNSTRAC
jgi:hypothetical protein